jgi:hypothetical protein
VLDLRSLPTAAEYLNVIAAELPGFAGLSTRMPFPLLEALIDRNHRVASLDDVWRRGLDEQLAILAAIMPVARQDSEFAAAVARAILSAESWRLLRQAIRNLGAGAVSALADWLPSRVSGTRLSMPSDVLTCIAEQADELVARTQTIGSNGPVAKALSGVLDPRSPRVQALGVDIWLVAARSALMFSDEAQELHSRALLLAVGIDAPDSRGGELLAASFATVHGAAADSRLPEPLWQMIEPFLPWYAFTWDRCIRLVRGALRGFLERGWESQYFFKVFSTDLARRQALHESEWSWEGRAYLRRLLDEHRHGLLVLDDQALSDMRRRAG